MARSRILAWMKLPSFRRASRSDQAVATGLDRVIERLDRLIELGERTNQLLEQLPPRDGSAEQASQLDEPRPTRAEAPAATRRRRRPKARADEPPQMATEEPRRLHEAIIQVLLDAGEPLTANELAARIRERNLYEPPRSGHELRGGQVSA